MRKLLFALVTDIHYFIPPIHSELNSSVSEVIINFLDLEDGTSTVVHNRNSRFNAFVETFSYAIVALVAQIKLQIAKPIITSEVSLQLASILANSSSFLITSGFLFRFSCYRIGGLLLQTKGLV